MKEKLFLATSAFKYYIDEERFIFKVIQPMFGTYDEETKVFRNFNGKEYYEILNKKVTRTDERIGFYNLENLVVLEEKFNTDSLEKIVPQYFEKYKGEGYYFDGVTLTDFEYVTFHEFLHSMDGKK